MLDLYDTRHDGSVRQLERQLEDIRVMQRELDQVEERCKGALGELRAAEKRS